MTNGMNLTIIATIIVKWPHRSQSFHCYSEDDIAHIRRCVAIDKAGAEITSIEWRNDERAVKVPTPAPVRRGLRLRNVLRHPRLLLRHRRRKGRRRVGTGASDSHIAGARTAPAAPVLRSNASGGQL